MKYIQGWPRKSKLALSSVFPDADPNSFSLIAGLLEFNPKIRLSAEQALAHPYLSAYHHPQDEPSHPSIFDVSFEQAQSIEEIKKLIVETVNEHKKLKALPRGSNPCSPTLAKPVYYYFPCITPYPVFSPMGKSMAESTIPRYEEDTSAAVSGGIEDELKDLSVV